MKNTLLHIILLLFLLVIGCKGKKQLASSAIVDKNMEVRVQRYLMSEFIDAKKYMLIDEPDKALALYQKILAEDPSCDACAYDIAQIAVKKNNSKMAEEMSNKAMTLSPNNPEYRKLQAEIQYRIGNYNEAAQIAKVLIDSFPQTRWFYREYVFYAQRAKQYENAEKAIDQFNAIFGYNRETSNYYEYLYEISGNKPKALNNLKTLALKYPTDYEVQKKYVISLMDNNNIVLAKETITKLETSEKHLLLSRINQSEKNWTDYAINIYLALQDSSINSNIILPYLIKETAIKDLNFIDALEKFSQREPKAIPYYQFYAKQNGTQTNELDLYKSIYLSTKNLENGKQYLNSMNQKRLWEKAETLAKELMENYPSYAENYINYAQALIDNGKYADAYAVADQGLIYAVLKQESTQCFLKCAWANHYLRQPLKSKETLEKAIASAENQEELEEIIFLTTVNNISPIGLDRALAKLKTQFPAATMLTVKALFMQPNYAGAEWEKLATDHPNDILLLEANLLKAFASKNLQAFDLIKTKLNNMYPNHSFYNTIK